jgi:iron complex transport system ATP-binding protein
MVTAPPLPLEAHGLVAGYGSRPVLRGLGLRLGPGALLGVVGPNGSGKSTLIRALTGRLPLREGSVLVGGRPVSALEGPALAREIAVVPQATPLHFAYTVREVVAMGRYARRGPFLPLSREDHDWIDRALDWTDTTALQHRPAAELSGGELQRVILARALAQDTPLLLLDEPTAHLDLGHQLDTFELLGRLCRTEGKTVLCVSHDLNLSAEFFEHLVLLSEGRIHAEGPPSEVITGDHLRAVYGASVVIRPNPYSGRPVIVVNRAGACAGEEPL